MKTPSAYLVLAAAVALSGCFTAGPPPVLLATPEPGEPLITLEIPVHIVLVGVEERFIDRAGLEAALPKDRVPLIESVSGSTGTPEYQRVRYTFTYRFHTAPPEFVRGLFEFALTTSESGRPNQWLVDYDANGPRRLGSADAPKDIHYLDALRTEDRIEESRARHGLAFEPNSVTVFLFDGEGAGVFPTDTYHYWRFDDGMGHAQVPKTEILPGVEPPLGMLDLVETAPFHTPKDPISMRAWGGRWNFVWLDLTAAPSAYDFTPRRPAEDWTDPPLWDVRNEPARLNANLGRDIADFLQIRVARDPIFPVEPFERFTTPIHVFVDAGTLENPATPLGVDLARWVPRADIETSLALLMPWVESRAPIRFYDLPEDDPGMFQALADARRYGDPTLVSEGVVTAYVRDHWDAYAPATTPGEFGVPQFYYYFNGPYTFWGVNSAGGWADTDAWGRPWAIFDHFYDACIKTDPLPCTKGRVGFQNLTLLPLHEAGHELGLTHTKDMSVLDEAQWTKGLTNWLWDSTYSLMSYRHVYMRFDHWDQRFLAVAHAVGYLERAHAARENASAEDRAASERAELEARELLARGAYVEGVLRARAAAEHAGASAPERLFAREERPERVELFRLVVPASRNVYGTPTLGLARLPNPLGLGLEDVTYATAGFVVPEDAPYFHVTYRDVTPAHAGAFRASGVRILGPDGSFRGQMTDSYEQERYFTSHWRGAGVHELRVYQSSGTAGLYEVEVGIPR